MKKILSLLALLVMTLTAFAKDYTGHRTVPPQSLTTQLCLLLTMVTARTT